MPYIFSNWHFPFQKTESPESSVSRSIQETDKLQRITFINKVLEFASTETNQEGDASPVGSSFDTPTTCSSTSQDPQKPVRHWLSSTRANIQGFTRTLSRVLPRPIMTNKSSSHSSPLMEYPLVQARDMLPEARRAFYEWDGTVIDIHANMVSESPHNSVPKSSKRHGRVFEENFSEVQIPRPRAKRRVRKRVSKEPPSSLFTIKEVREPAIRRCKTHF